jgi:hypothetical protein
MQQTELPNRPVATLLLSAWRITALYFQQSWRLYVGPAQWKGFPDSMAFVIISMALTIPLNAVQLLLSGHPLSVYWVNLLIAVGAGTIILMVRHDMPFNSAGFGVVLVGLLLSIVLESLQSSLAGRTSATMGRNARCPALARRGLADLDGGDRSAPVRRQGDRSGTPEA